ncbi:SdpA family antimicrobial peptide system protein [Psychroflexus sp. MBR-150]|jgi:antimicrobial peptide system SdpA family protein
MKERFVLYILIICLSVYIVFLIFFSSLNFNVNTPSYNTKFGLNLSIPEGWGFFTRNPREDMIDIYRINDDNKLVKSMYKNGHYSNYFGFSRKSRKIAMEVSIIANQIEDSIWVKKTNPGMLEIPIFKKEVDNEFLYFLDTGEYLLVKRKTVPWAWRKNINRKHIPYEVAHIKIKNF